MSLPSIKVNQRNQAAVKFENKQSSGPRVVNFNEESLTRSPSNLDKFGDQPPNKHVNISQQINKMIPVRGPTLFEKRMNEFLHGPASKSGGLKKALIPMQRKSTVKNLIRSSTHDVKTAAAAATTIDGTNTSNNGG